MKTKILLALGMLLPVLGLAQTFPVNNLQINGSIVSPTTIQTGLVNGNSLTINSAPNVNQGAQVHMIGNGVTTPGKYFRTFNGNFQIINDANSQVLFSLNDAGNLTLFGGITASSFAGAVFPSTPLSVGTAVYPTIVGPLNTTATTTNASTSITVTNPAGLAVGMGIYASFVPGSCNGNETGFMGNFITAIAGTSVTMSCPATSTNVSPVAVQFGQQRYSTTSTIIANDVGVQTLKVGSASQGNTASWLNQISTGQDFRLTSAAQIVAPPGGGYGITVAARSSDATGGAAAFPIQSLLFLDSWPTTNYNSENLYLQDNLLPATAGHGPHIQFEQTIESGWPATGGDPYSINQTNQTVGHRIDCGSGGPGGVGPTDQNCTSAIDIVPNNQSFYNGILIANGGLVAGGNAVAMPLNNNLTWFSAASTYSAAIGSASAGILSFNVPGTNGQFQFSVNGANEFSVAKTLIYVKPDTFANTAVIGCSGGTEGFEGSITDGNTAAFNAVVAGGGANHVKIRCNGTNWVVF